MEEDGMDNLKDKQKKWKTNTGNGESPPVCGIHHSYPRATLNIVFLSQFLISTT